MDNGECQKNHDSVYDEHAISLRQALEDKVKDLETQIARLTDINDKLCRTNEDLVRELAVPKALEQSLLDSEAHYRLLTENAPDVVWRLDSNYRFTYISPSDERLRGYRADEVSGTPCLNIFDEEGVAAVMKLAEERREAELRGVRMGTTTFEARHSCKDGSWIWAEVSSTPVFDEDGNITGFYGITREFTQRKQAEILLQQAKIAAEEASKAKSEFLALVSHEIRTPLNSLVGFSSMARTTTDPLKLDQYHAILEQSSRSLMDLVNNILDMSKIEAGRLEFEAVPFNLQQLITDLEDCYRPPSEEKKLSFVVDLADDLPVWLLGDPFRLRQILANLLANAVKFTERGEISCRISLAESSEDGSPPSVLFKLCDTGIGIPVNKQSQLFKPFQQLDPGISRKYGGSGLGLAIVQRLAVMMGGSIAVDSREGEGSCFSVLLPLPGTTPPPEAALTCPVSLALGMVLVVEGHLLEDLLIDWGQQVTLAEDGRHGLQLMEQQNFDLILLDIRMPDIDGIEVARRIRRRENESFQHHVPIIAITADVDSGTRHACLQVGINAVLSKPVIPDELARAIALHCSDKDDASSALQHLFTPETLKGIGNDPERIRKYRELLFQDIDEELRATQWALAREDRGALVRCAHTLKGLSSQMVNRSPVELAAWLQHNGSSAPLKKLVEVLAQLQIACSFTLNQEEKP